MPNQYTAVVRRWFEEVWNQGHEAAIDELLAVDAIAQGIAGPDGQQVRGPAGYKPLFHQYRTAFPDIHIAIEDTLVDGDRIVVRCRVTGTHNGRGLMATPPGNEVDFIGICIAYIRDGQIAEAWNSFDFLSMPQQIGLRLS
jgi:predicted ester cyclase